MCPVIDDADLTGVSTKFEALPADTYEGVIKSAEIGESKKNKLPQVVIVTKVDMPSSEYHNREIYDYITLKQKDGAKNEIGHKQLKRYFEAVLGKDAANTAKPNTDDLKNGRVKLVLDIEEYEEKVNNKVKRVMSV